MLMALAGKGGVGKTTLSASLARLWQSEGKDFCLIDADPVGRLGRLLGLRNGAEHTVAQLAEADEAIDLDLALQPLPEGGHLIRMGYPRKAGCFCRVNGLTRLVLDAAAQRFPLLLMDNEAGLEHLTRGTSLGIDELVLVADESRAALDVARETLDTARALGRLRGRARLVMRTSPGMSRETLIAAIHDALRGLPEPRLLPHSPQIALAQLAGQPLPAFSPSLDLYCAVAEWLGDGGEPAVAAVAQTADKPPISAGGTGRAG